MNKANTPVVCLRTLAPTGPPGTTTFNAVTRAIGTLVILLLLGTSLEAASISLAWDANAESDLAGYIVSYGTTSGVYTNEVTVGNQTTWTATGLTAGQRYYFALKAYNHDQLQSSFSVEVDGVAPTGVTPSVLNLNNVNVTEGASGTALATFTATLSPASTQTVTVNYTTVNGTATGGSDYVAANGILTFAPGVSTRPIGVTLNGDTTVEPNETFSVTLSGALNAVLGTASGTGTIMNDDAAAPPTVTASPATVTPGSVITTIVANGPGNPRDWAGLYPTGAPDTGFVAWQYFNGSETPPAAGMPSATLQFTAPTTPGSYNVRIYADDLMGIPAAISNTINVQALPALAVNGISVTEGQSGTTAAAFTVTLSPVSTQTVTVSYTTSNGTATAGSDYVAASGVLTFAPGVSTRPISVTVNGDTTVEPNETFSVTLSAAANAILGTASGTGTITNDDTLEPRHRKRFVTRGPQRHHARRFHGDAVTRQRADRHGQLHDGQWHGDCRQRLRRSDRSPDLRARCQHSPDQRHREWRHDGRAERDVQCHVERPIKRRPRHRVRDGHDHERRCCGSTDGDRVADDGHRGKRDRRHGCQRLWQNGRLGRACRDHRPE